MKSMVPGWRHRSVRPSSGSMPPKVEQSENNFFSQAPPSFIIYDIVSVFISIGTVSFYHALWLDPGRSGDNKFHLDHQWPSRRAVLKTSHSERIKYGLSYWFTFWCLAVSHLHAVSVPQNPEYYLMVMGARYPGGRTKTARRKSERAMAIGKAR